MRSKYAHKTSKAEFFFRVCVKFKHVRDTIKECARRRQVWGPYTHGEIKPHFPVPAIPLQVEVNRWAESGPYHNSITISHKGGHHLVAIFDYNFDRCMDFHYKVGVYVNEREIYEGIQEYMKERRGVQKDSDLY